MKALVSDFDGTLYFYYENPRVKKIDIKKINEFQKDNLFILCTGRSLQGVKILKDYHINCDYYISVSGAIITDKDKNIIFKRCLDKTIVQNVLDKLNTFQICVITENRMYRILNKACFPQKKGEEYSKDVNSLDEELYGMSIHAKNDEEAEKLAAFLNKKYEVKALQNGEFIDVVPQDCSKGIALNFIKNYLHLDHVGAIGDSYNDIDMLKQADVSFTFENSPNRVKKYAQYQVSGIAQALDYM